MSYECGQLKEYFDELFYFYFFFPDLQAIRLAFGDYLTIGDFNRMRNLMSRAVLHCPKEFVLYPYVLSL